MAAAADRRFDFSHVITFDPAACVVSRNSVPLSLSSQTGLDTWDRTPLLAINSEEYANGDEFAKLLALALCGIV